MTTAGGTHGLVPLHIGLPSPKDTAASDQPATQPGAAHRRVSASVAALTEVDWEAYGAEARWLSSETSDCSVAVQPALFRQSPGFERFLAGARNRNEMALVVAVLGEPDDDSPHNPPSPSDGSLLLTSNFLLSSAAAASPTKRGSGWLLT